MRYALVGAGSVGNSFIADLPHLSRELGPVAAASFRLASRMVNTLGAGSPVKSMDSLDSSQIILICAAGAAIERIIGGLSRANINWHHKTLLLCDSNLYSDVLRNFHSRGAATGSINPLGGLSGRFVLEGDPAARRKAKHLAQELKAKTIELDRGKVQSYGAALTFSSSLFTPLVDCCVECLKDAGVTHVAARHLAESLFQRSLRTYMHAGRKGWSGTIASGDEIAIEREMEGLRGWEPLIAEYYRTSAVFALEFFRRYPELLNRLKLAPPPSARVHGGHPRPK